MELIGTDEVTEGEREIAHFLESHPHVRKRFALIANGYRELAMLHMEDGEKPDPSDMIRSVAKKDNALRRIGIPILQTAQDWENLRRS